LVPGRELHRYATVVQSLTSGRGVHQEVLDHYEVMPGALEAEVVAQVQRESSGKNL